jgi:hypothetical protein
MFHLLQGPSISFAGHGFQMKQGYLTIIHKLLVRQTIFYGRCKLYIPTLENF